MAPDSQDQSLFKQVVTQPISDARSSKGKAKIADILNYLIYALVGLGFLFTIGKYVYDQSFPQSLRLEIRIVGGNVNEGDEILIQPFGVTLKLDAQKSIIHDVDDYNFKLKEQPVTLVLIRKNNGSQIVPSQLTSIYVKERTKKLLLVYQYVISDEKEKSSVVEKKNN